MLIRTLKKADKSHVEAIFALYWTDKSFLAELSGRLEMYLEKTPENLEEKLNFFVAEERGEIVGIGGFLKAPSYLRKYAGTDTPVELYILASKYRGSGIGGILRAKMIDEAKNLGFTEVMFYSPHSHKESWSFHDTLGAERMGEVIAPDGEPGQVWRKLL